MCGIERGREGHSATDATPLGLIAGRGVGLFVTQGSANPGLNSVSPLGLVR